MDDLRLSTPQEAPLQASKWLQSQVLIDVDEMGHLFNFLGPFSFFQCGTVTRRREGELAQETFLKHYQSYIHTLKEGLIPTIESYQAWFSPVMTASKDTLFAIPIDEQRQLIRIAKPVIQLQAHNLNYSSLDQKFRSMVFGSDSIPWGLQFSYPQLYQNNAGQVEQVRSIPDFLNNTLFHNLQKWVRQFTTPTRFSVGNTQINVPVRLGRGCVSWINNHVQLKNKGIKVEL